MAGQGKRFRQAGYDTYKPFLPIFGKPMVQYVLDAFPEHVAKHVVADPTLLTDEQLAYLRRQPGVTVHCVASHHLGPAYSIHLARGELPLDERFFISYCDIFWTWDWSQVESQLDADGVVYTRRQFHPHLVGNNYSAFCRPAPDEPDVLSEIREKTSFTADWMTEPLSVGCFYVRDGRAMMRAIDGMIAENRTVSQEFFPSLIFNDLIAAGKRIRLHDVDFFVHWGVPAQLEDLRQWVRTSRALAATPSPDEGVNVCCMGGAGVRMQALGPIPKALIPLGDGEPMFRYVSRRFACRRNYYLVPDSMQTVLRAHGVPGEEIVAIGPRTGSQLETLRRASGFLAQQSRFFLTACDAFGVWDRQAFQAFVDREAPDAVIFTFEPTLLQERLAGCHTYVQTAGDAVTHVHIKHKPTQPASGLAGFFWFRDGAVFAELDGIPDDPGRELCADHVLKYMVARGQRVLAFPLDAYLHPGSPAELQEFVFWNRYHALFGGSPQHETDAGWAGYRSPITSTATVPSIAEAAG
jgi:NDP-sugar pyrophosphorylase family protein